MARHSDDDGDENDRKPRRSHSRKSKNHERDRDYKSYKRNDEDEAKRGGEKQRLTEEETRLYEKARAFVHHQQREDERRGHRDEGRHKKRSRKDDVDVTSSDGSNDRKRRRHKSTSDRHKAHRRNEHKHRKSDQDREKHKKAKHHHHRDREHSKREKQRRKSSSIDTSKLIPLGPILSHPPAESLKTSLHYFSHNPHLRLYLYRAHSLYFEDLSSDDARSYFEEFVKIYNSGRLEEAYYNPTLPQEALDQCLRTKHQWKFRTNDVEKEKLNMVREGVRKQTEYEKGASARNTGGNDAKSAPPVTTPQTHVTKDNQDDYHDKDQQRLEARAAQRQSDKKYRERIKLVNEELDPHQFAKPISGWERQQEKKRQRSNATHGAYQDREDVIAGGDLDDDAIYGDGEVSGGGGGGRRRKDLTYEEAVYKERQRREKREAEMAAKVEDAKRKEEQKRKEMLAMLGLSGVDAGKKITIAPRQDGA